MKISTIVEIVTPLQVATVGILDTVFPLWSCRLDPTEQHARLRKLVKTVSRSGSIRAWVVNVLSSLHESTSLSLQGTGKTDFKYTAVNSFDACSDSLSGIRQLGCARATITSSHCNRGNHCFCFLHSLMCV